MRKPASDEVKGVLGVGSFGGGVGRWLEHLGPDEGAEAVAAVGGMVGVEEVIS